MSARRFCSGIGLLLWLGGPLAAPVLADTTAPRYDPNGNLASRTTALGTTDYTYDALDRLKTEFGPGVDQTFNYDPNGNRRGDGTNTYTIAPNGNRIQKINGVTVTYDPAGHLLDDGRGRTFAYNAAGRLKEVRVDDILVASYKYNYRGQRTHKITPPGTTLYHYDAQGHLIQTGDPGGTPKQSLHWAGDRPLAQVDHTGPTDKLVYLHTDQLNTPRLASDADRNIVWRWEGGAFGETAPEGDPDNNGITTTINLRYAGMYSDSETGLHYWGTRYYDPKTGRGISADRKSVGEHVQNWLIDLRALGRRHRLNGSFDDVLAQASIVNRPPLELNPYAYVANNPLRWVDPTGESAASAIEWCITHPAACGSAAAATGSAAGAAILGGIGALLYPPALCENEDEERCKKVKEQCIQGCSDFVLQKPRGRRGDSGGMDFHRCVRQCMDRNGC